MSSHSPPITSTPLEACRIAPYVNIPSLRTNGSSLANSSSNSQSHYPSSPAGYFDPAILTAAHQVIKSVSQRFKDVIFLIECLNLILIGLFIFVFLISHARNLCVFFLLHFFEQYAAAISGGNVGNGLFTIPQYPLGLAALAVAHNKNSSIADLRLKAKKHAEALGLAENAS
jgi:short stature homeobox protein